jgi:ankyrin repeat protein
MIAAVVLCVIAIVVDSRFDWPLALPLATPIWWLALACIASSAAASVVRRRTEMGPGTALASAAILIGLHGVLMTALLALPAYAWWRGPSLPATLAIATAIAAATLLPWRLWPALALVLSGQTADADPARSSAWHVARSLRGARVLTMRSDVFLSRGLPLLCLHGVLLLSPLAMMLASGWPWSLRLGASALVIALAWIVYRLAVASGESLRQQTIAMPTADEAAARADEPIPTSALLRAAALRDALRSGAIDRSLAIIQAGVHATAPALPDEDDQRDALIIAATLNDSRPLRAMIAAGADVNHRSRGLTPLLAATRDSYYGREETVIALLANGADLSVCDDGGRTALHHAALSAQPSVSATLLDAGAPIDAVDGDGHTPLTLACSVGNAAVVALLIDRRATISAGSIPALCAAASAASDDIDIIARLLRMKIAADVADGDGRSPLHHAVVAGNIRVAGALVAAGAAVDVADREGRTPLHLACEHHDAESSMVGLLRSAGADLDAADATGSTPRSLLAQRKGLPSVDPIDVHPEQSAVSAAVENIGDLLASGRISAVRAWLRTATPAQRAEGALAAAAIGLERSIEEALWLPLPADAALPDGCPLIDEAIGQWPVSVHLLRALPQAGVSISGGARLARLLASDMTDTDELQALAIAWLDAGADPFGAVSSGTGPLHLAVSRGCERLVAKLLERGSDARAVDRNGVTPLHLAMRNDDAVALRLALLLIRHGADPEAGACSGETPLGLALDADRRPLVEWLRWRGWSLPGRRLGDHDLVAAADAGDGIAVRRLITLGLDVNGRDVQGCTALIRAAGNGHRALLDELIGLGADVGARSQSGATAMVAALMRGHVDIVEALLAHGTPVDQRFANDATGLMIAAACGSTKAIDALLVAGADIAAHDAAGNTPLHAAAGYAFGSADAMLARTLLLNLITAGADVESVNGAGLTPLHVACGAAAATRANSAGIDAALDILLSRTQGVTAIDGGGCTPLHYAAAHGQLGAVRRLLARGAEPARRDHGGWRAEDYAHRYGYTEVAQTLRPASLSASLPLRPA